MSLFSSIGNAFKGVTDFLNPISPLLNVGANLLGTFSAKSAQEEANETNVQLQRENQRWEENLANTAHQREVADLKAAGLNPILSAKLGGSATPVVAPARVESLAPTYLSSARQFSETNLANRSLLAEIELKRSQTGVNSALQNKAFQESRMAAYNADVAEIDRDIALQQAKFRQSIPAWARNSATAYKDWMNTFLDPVSKVFSGSANVGLRGEVGR